MNVSNEEKYKNMEDILKDLLFKNSTNMKELLKCMTYFSLAFYDLDKYQKEDYVTSYRQLTTEAAVLAYEVAVENVNDLTYNGHPNTKGLISCTHDLYSAFLYLDESQKEDNIELCRKLIAEATVLAYEVAEENLKYLLSNNNSDKNMLFSYMNDFVSAYLELDEFQKDENMRLYHQIMDETNELLKNFI